MAEKKPSPLPSGRHILIAEDSPVTQDLLQLVLSKHGHTVEMVEDGVAALDTLKKTRFDVALVDFHMPGMTGLEVVRALLDDVPPHGMPHFVAITGDVEGLLQSDGDCEAFDQVMPKPLDVTKVCAMIDALEGPGGQAALARRRDQSSSHMPVSGRAANRANDDIEVEQALDFRRLRRVRSPIEDLDYRFMRWPEDKGLRFMTSAGAGGADRLLEFDAILICEPLSRTELEELWHAPGLHLVPVIDLTGTLGPSADLDGSTLATGKASQAQELIEAFRERTKRLHYDLQVSDALSDMLLGRVLASGGNLIPRLDPGRRSFVGYNTTLDDVQTVFHARRLVDNGMLETSFFQRTHECANCGSARFLVQEVCPGCASPELDEQSFVHHFRCAYQSPESDFIKGDDLICPKCRRELRHFGRDYDRPGTVVTCRACSTSTTEPSVSFRCIDCSSTFDGDAVGTRDVYAYKLTDAAIGYLEVGRSYMGFAQKSLRFADLPLDLVVALNAEARKYNETGWPFTLVSIGYQMEREVLRDHGPRQFTNLRTLFLETLAQQLGEECTVARGQSFDFALIRNRTVQKAEALLDSVREKAVAPLKVDIGPIFSAFGPEDIA